MGTGVKVHEEVLRYGWPGSPEGRCRLNVYLGEEGVLVVVRDLDDHQGPSVTNAMERVAEGAWEVLMELGLTGKPVRWIHWSRTDGVAAEVLFRNPLSLLYPRWRRLTEEEARTLLAQYGGQEDLDRWIELGEFTPR